MILGRVVLLSLLMVGCIVATPWAYQQDPAVMALRLRAIQQMPSPIRLSNGERIDTTTYRGKLEALETLATGSDNDRWQLADAYYLFAWRQAGGKRELAQIMFQDLTGLVSIREANRLFDQCAKRAPTVAATETAKAIQAAEAAKAAQQAKSAEAARAAHAAVQAWQQRQQQLPQQWTINCERVNSNSYYEGDTFRCHATRRELRVTLSAAIIVSPTRPNKLTVQIDMGPHSAASKVWFDNDTPSQKISLSPAGPTADMDARRIVERLLTASVLHYEYTSTELPQGENTDIPVDGFAQVWKDTQAFAKQGAYEARSQRQIEDMRRMQRQQ